MSKERGEDNWGLHIKKNHFFFLVNETCHPIWYPMIVKKMHVIYSMYIKCTQSSLDQS